MDDDAPKTRIHLVEPLGEPTRFPERKLRPWELPGLEVFWYADGLLGARRFDGGRHAAAPLTWEVIAEVVAEWGESAEGVETARFLLTRQDEGLRTKPRNRSSCAGGSTLNGVCIRCGKDADSAHFERVWPWADDFDDYADDDGTGPRAA